MKPKFLAKSPGGFRLGPVEFYRIVGERDWSIIRGSCDCLIVSLGRFGVTWLSSKYDCYQKADETEQD